MMRQRDKTNKQLRKIKTYKDWEFKVLRNRTVDICRKAKREYLENKLDKSKNKPK